MVSLAAIVRGVPTIHTDSGIGWQGTLNVPTVGLDWLPASIASVMNFTAPSPLTHDSHLGGDYLVVRSGRETNSRWCTFAIRW